MTEADFMRWLSDRIEYTQEEIDEADTRTSEAEDRRIASYSPDYSEGEAQGGGQVGNGVRATQEGARGTSEKGFSLTGQTNEQAAAQHAQKPSDEITKEQIDKERDAVPFSLAQESQPKPVGVQGSLIGANGKPSKQSPNRTEALITEEPNAPPTVETKQAEAQRPQQRPAAIANSPHAQRIAKELPGAQDVQVHSSDSLGSETSSLTSGQMSKWRAKTIERIAKAFGRKSVVFFSAANETADGMMISGTNDPLYININSGIDPLAVVGHEWRHSIKQTNKTAHDAIQAAAKAILAKDDRLIDYAMNYHGSELK